MNEMISPLQEEDGDAADRLWIAAVRQGDRRALEELIQRHQGSIYNLSLRMPLNRHDAEDATQEILIKLITKLSTFQGRSRFRTWLYRIAANHLLNMKRGRCEAKITSFEAYRERLDETPNLDLPDPACVPVDLPLLVEEAKIGCMTAMLLCLSREQRLVYLLGEIFQVGDVTGGKIIGIGRAHFRQKLSRARRDLHRFMNEQCGLLNKSNPCRCERKTAAWIREGLVDPNNLQFNRNHRQKISEVAPELSRRLETWIDAEYVSLFRDHPFQDPPDFVARLREILQENPLRRILAGMD